MAESLTIFRCRSFKNGGRLRRDVGRIRDRATWREAEEMGRNARDPPLQFRIRARYVVIARSTSMDPRRILIHLTLHVHLPCVASSNVRPSLERRLDPSGIASAIPFFRSRISKKKKKTFERKFHSYINLYNEYM